MPKKRFVIIDNDDEFPSHAIATDWIFCKDAQEIRKKNPYMSGNGLWKIPIDNSSPIEMPVPYMAGCVMDSYGNWFPPAHTDVNWGITDIFMNDERKKNGIELLRQLYACGKKAGIDKAMFVGFGTALGIVRHDDFIPNDRDMDMCIVADWITPGQGSKYIEFCKDAGLGEHRWHKTDVRPDTGMPLWFSLGPKNPVSENGIKCCQWFWFSHDNYWWHSKGSLWIDPNKFSPRKTSYSQSDAAIAKGISFNCLNKLIPYNFKGAEINLPDNLGRCLDEWYPGWMIPREGASAHSNILVIGKWEDKSTWRIT
jgi:hypothetical protein